MSQAFAVNPGWTVQAHSVGREAEPVLVIDNVLLEPESLVEAAAAAEFSPLQRDGNFYPGQRAPAPRDYVHALLAALGPVFGPVFGGRRLARTTCALSLATLRPEELVLAQRLPHFDTAEGGQVAVLHYLCGPDQGGTAFYRHRATGLETVTPERRDAYLAVLGAEVAAAPPPQAYVAGDTPLFEQTGRVEARMNRLAIYRSHLLHSGEMGEACAFSPDPRVGRLTANIFLMFEG